MSWLGKFQKLVLLCFAELGWFLQFIDTFTILTQTTPSPSLEITHKSLKNEPFLASWDDFTNQEIDFTLNFRLNE